MRVPTASQLPAPRPAIRKLGTIDCDLVEATPVVHRGRLYRFEYVRPTYPPNRTGDSYFRFVDVAASTTTPGFGAGYHLGSAHVEGETAYVYGVAGTWGGDRIDVLWSPDLAGWSSRVALHLPGWELFNTSVCRGDGRYVMAFEVGAPPEVVGQRFTMRFAASDDLRAWRLLPEECVFSKDRYTACPALRFLDDGYYYMLYLEAVRGEPTTYETHLVRSRDLVSWQGSPLNPVLRHSAEDKRIGNPALTAAQREHIAGATNRNNSDVDLCEHEGRTVITYSWGNQLGVEFLAEAVHDGPLAQFLRAWFP
jgi:hypothetical protein